MTEKVKGFMLESRSGVITLQFASFFAICVNIAVVVSWKKDLEHDVQVNAQFRWTSIHQLMLEQEFNASNSGKGVVWPSTKKILNDVDWDSVNKK